MGWNTLDFASTSYTMNAQPCNMAPCLWCSLTHCSPSDLLTSYWGPAAWLFCISHTWPLILSAISSLKSCFNPWFCYFFNCVLLLFSNLYLFPILNRYFIYMIQHWKASRGYRVETKAPSIPHLSLTESPFAKAATVSSFLSISQKMALHVQIFVCTNIFLSLYKV